MFELCMKYSQDVSDLLRFGSRSKWKCAAIVERFITTLQEVTSVMIDPLMRTLGVHIFFWLTKRFEPKSTDKCLRSLFSLLSTVLCNDVID